ncbi:MAG: hypothetical protein K6A63_02090 [Acholeplasmatales bacterium]|nr:hypothetical protein [Acholeplasmatales bacterium]
MKTTINIETESPVFELDELETQELVETGYVETNDGFCITMRDNEITVYKEFEDYDGLKLYKKQ